MEEKKFAPPPLLSQAHKIARGRGVSGDDDEERDRTDSVEAGLAVLQVPAAEGRGHGFSVAWRSRVSVEGSTVQQACYSTQMAGEALSRMQESLAVFIEAAVLAVGDSYKKPGTDGKIWLRITENVEQGCLFAIESMAFGEGLGEILCLLLDWLPTLGAQLTTKKTTAEQKAHNFDEFIHLIPSYDNTKAALSELLENLVESVVVEVVALILSHYDGGDHLSRSVCQRLLEYAFHSALKLRAMVLPQDLFGALRRHVLDQWAYVLGRITPQHFGLVVDHLLIAQNLAEGGDFVEENMASLFHFIRHVHLRWSPTAVGPDHTSLAKLLDAYTASFAAHPSPRVRRPQVESLDAILQQVDATSVVRGSAPPEITILADHLERIYGQLDKWNPRKSQDKELGAAYNLLQATILARATKMFYGGNVELFWRKRLLKVPELG